MNYEQELYNAIAASNVFKGEQAHAVEDGVVFEIAGVSGVEDFVVIGRSGIDAQDEPKPVEFLGLTMVLAKNIALGKVSQVEEKLYELNVLFKSAIFSIESDGTLLLEASFPVIRDDVETSVKLFNAEFTNIMDFLDGLYPYILRVVALPEDSDLTEYLRAAFALTNNEE